MNGHLKMTSLRSLQEKCRKLAESYFKTALSDSGTFCGHSSGYPGTQALCRFSSLHSRIGILNGMGTKGCSLAPYFARQLVDNLKGEGIINPLADINRFEKILNRPF